MIGRFLARSRRIKQENLDYFLTQSCFGASSLRMVLLLREGANPDARDDRFSSPPVLNLTASTISDGDEKAGILLSAGANPDAQDNDGNTAFHEATRYTHIKILRKLAAWGANPFLKNREGKTPLGIAREKLASCESDKNVKAEYIARLHEAVAILEGAEKHYDPAWKNSNKLTDIKNTPLKDLLSQKHKDGMLWGARTGKYVREALAIGANPYLTDDEGRTVLLRQLEFKQALAYAEAKEAAKSRRQEEPAPSGWNVLGRFKEKLSGIFAMAAVDGMVMNEHYNNMECAEELIKAHPALVNKAANNGLTPLIAAVILNGLGFECRNLIKLMLDNGADIHAAYYGMKAVDYARQTGTQQDIVNILEEEEKRQPPQASASPAPL